LLYAKTTISKEFHGAMMLNDGKQFYELIQERNFLRLGYL